MSEDLALYLDRLAHEGEQDSQGTFSVDYARALEKLSARLFSDPTSWLIKLVQAAVASGTRQLEVRSHRDRLEVHFHSSSLTSESFYDLQALLHDPLGTEDQPALAHFLRAFHAARAARPLSLGWAIVDQQGGFSYLVQGEEIQRHTLSAQESAGATCVFALRPQAGKASWAEEQKALTGRCALSPASIHWDNRPINPALPQVMGQCLLDRIYLSREASDQLLHLPHLTEVPSLVYDLGHGYKDHYSYGQTILHQWRSYMARAGHRLWDSQPAPDFQILESDVVQELFGIPKTAYAINHGAIRAGRLEGLNNFYQILYVQHLNIFTTAAEPVRQGRFGSQHPPCAQAWLRCPVTPEGESRLLVQKDGVLLDPMPIEVGLAGVRAFVADDTVQTDLSGLVPVRNERIQELEKWLRLESILSRKDLRKALRWGDKYGLNEAAVKRITQVHKLDQDE